MSWRVGRTVPLNVYDGDRAVCQCHAPDDALRIVDAMNAAEEKAGKAPILRLCDLDLSTRTYNCFRSALAGDPLSADASQLLLLDWSRIKYFGASSFFNAIEAFIQCRGCDVLKSSPCWILAPYKWQAGLIHRHPCLMRGDPNATQKPDGGQVATL